MQERAPARGKRILVAEDEAMISVVLSGDLRDEGYAIAGPFSREKDALEWLKSKTPDVAIVDYMLREGPCRALLRLLRERGVPFVIFSGYPRDSDKDNEFADARWFDKPASLDELLAALGSLSQQASSQS
jgi:DNA-binding response OmpR family regulator